MSDRDARLKRIQHHESCDSRFASVCGDSQRCSCGLDWLVAELDAARVNVESLRAKAERHRVERDAALAHNEKLTERVQHLISVKQGYRDAELTKLTDRVHRLTEVLETMPCGMWDHIHSTCAAQVQGWNQGPDAWPMCPRCAALAEGEDTRD